MIVIRETPDLIKVTRYVPVLDAALTRVDETITDVRVYELRPGDLISKDHDAHRRYRVLSLPTQTDAVVEGVVYPNVWTVEVEDAEGESAA